MPLGTIDFSGALSAFEPIEAQDVPVTFDKYEVVQNSAAGKNPDGQHIRYTCTVVSDDEALSGKKVSSRWALTSGSLWRIQRDLVALGADPTSLEGENVELETVIKGVVGRMAIATVTKESYMDQKKQPPEERWTNNIDKFTAIPVEEPSGRRRG